MLRRLGHRGCAELLLHEHPRRVALDPALLEQPMLQKALEDANIPFTAFKYSEDTGQFQVIREQAGTFADALKLWGNA